MYYQSESTQIFVVFQQFQLDVIFISRVVQVVARYDDYRNMS